MKIMTTRRIILLGAILMSLFLTVSAYEYLTVEVPITLNIVAPDQANIALVPGHDTWKGPSGSTTYVGDISSGYLQLRLGPWAKRYKVFYSNAFNITNYDDEPWEFWFDVTGTPTGVTLTFKYWDGSSWQTITSSSRITLDSGETQSIGIEFNIDTSASSGSQTWTIHIYGQEQGATGTPSNPGAPTG